MLVALCASPRKSNSLSMVIASCARTTDFDLRPAIRAAVIIKGTLKEGAGPDASYVLSYGGTQFNREAALRVLRLPGGTFRCPEVPLGANACCASDRLRAFCHNQHSQYGCCIANVSRNRQECFRHGRMLFRQSLKPRADTVELIDFAQDRCKRHRQTAFSLKSLRWENFRWTGLGQRT